MYNSIVSSLICTYSESLALLCTTLWKCRGQRPLQLHQLCGVAHMNQEWHCQVAYPQQWMKRNTGRVQGTVSLQDYRCLYLFHLLKKSFDSFSFQSPVVTYWSFVATSTCTNKISAHASCRNSNSHDYSVVRARNLVLYHLVTLVLQAQL